MKRRTTLRLCALGVASLAGCVSSGDGTGNGDATGTPTPTSEPSPTGTRSPSPSSTGTSTPGIVARSFDAGETRCGSGEDRASVSVDGCRVVVDGTVRGSNTCATARLAGASYDAANDALTVSVESHQPDGAAACGQCITDVDYRATVRFDRDLPATVRVRHDGNLVVEAMTG